MTRGAPARVGVVVLVLAAAVLAVLALRVGSGPADGAPDPRASSGRAPVASTSPGEGAEADPDGSAAPLVVPEGATAARPVEVRVDSVGIVSRLDRLDQVDGGEVEAPPRWQVAGWYVGGARPGETGPAVIAGHVDSPTGPAVFAALDQVQVGDLVTVTDADGTVHRFRVDRTEVAPRQRFPTRAVYGPTPDAQLRLVTCDGPYVAAAGGYQDNFIVYATALAA